MKEFSNKVTHPWKSSFYNLHLSQAKGDLPNQNQLIVKEIKINNSLGIKQMKDSMEQKPVYTKSLYVFTGMEDRLKEIIRDGHAVDTSHMIVDKKGQLQTVEIKRVKNLVKMYPKYVYALHYLITKALHQPIMYKEGIALSRNAFAERTCCKHPVASMILRNLVESGIIIKVRNHYHRRNIRKSSTYRFTEAFEDMINNGLIKKQVFNGVTYGKMIQKLVTLDERYEEQFVQSKLKSKFSRF